MHRSIKVHTFAVLNKHQTIMSGNKILLNNGIVIEDQRHLGCGVQINNQQTQFMSLGYSQLHSEFYLNMRGRWITIDDYPEFYKELDSMRLALVEATELIKERNS